MNKRFGYFGLLSGVLFTALMMLSFAYEQVEAQPAEPIKLLPQRVAAIDMNRTFTFAGSDLPMSYDVMERLDRELLVNSYWQSNTLLNLKRANRYFPEIEQILRQEGVPDDFKYLAVAESGLLNVTSSANATGFWQFRKLAAKEFGLEVNDEVDERYHLEKSTRAAAQYIKQLQKRFGTWIDAAAAYNMGPTNYAKILKAQGESSYYDLNLGEESSRYVFRIVAIKEIMSQSEEYGFILTESDKYTPLDKYYEVEVNTSVDSWKEFATKYGVSYRTLKIYNPWLRDNKLTVKNNKYLVKIPRS
jgi:membrane-bound lytic murein transglycosylase D